MPLSRMSRSRFPHSAALGDGERLLGADDFEILIPGDQVRVAGPGGEAGVRGSMPGDTRGPGVAASPDWPTPVRGSSVARLIARGDLPAPVAALCLIPIGLESTVGAHETLWALSWLSVLILLVGGGVALKLYGYRKRAAEIAAGYTSELIVYLKNRDLYLLDAVTFDVLLEPTLPWRSQETDRLIAEMRGEKTYRPDASLAGLRRVAAEVAPIEAEQQRSAIGHRPVRRGTAWAVLVGPLAGLAFAGWMFLHLEKTPPAHHRPSPVSLRHVTVEQRIEVFGNVDGVVCNDGHNITVTTVGQTFTCRGPNGALYIVRITNPHTAAFVIGD